MGRLAWSYMAICMLAHLITHIQWFTSMLYPGYKLYNPSSALHPRLQVRWISRAMYRLVARPAYSYYIHWYLLCLVASILCIYIPPAWYTFRLFQDAWMAFLTAVYWPASTGPRQHFTLILHRQHWSMVYLLLYDWYSFLLHHQHDLRPRWTSRYWH